MKHLKKILALALALSLLSSCALFQLMYPDAVRTPAVTSEPVETTAPPSPAETAIKTYFTDEGHEDFDYTTIAYYHYDDAQFLSSVDRITELCDTDGAFDEITSLYQYCYEEIVTMVTLNTKIYLDYYADVNDESLGDEAVWSDSLVNDDFDYLCTALQLVTGSPYAEQFSTLVGEETYAYFASYITATDRETELWDAESELEVLYEQQAASDEYSVEMYGRTWTFSSLDAASANMGYTQYYAILDALEEQFFGVLGDTYMQLLSIRTELANLYGYDSYADYAYENTYGRDYSTDDIKAFRDAVKEFVAPAFFDIYTDDAFYADLDASYSADDLLGILGTYISDISPEMTDAYDYMMRNNLYYIGNTDSMSDGGFTTELYGYDAPFIYFKTYGDVSDVSGIVHEFGHYNDSFYNGYGNILTSQGSYDIFEIHSTGLEVLFYDYYDEIFGDIANEAKIVNGGYLLAGIVYGCIHDEFQEYVYDHPDMTIDEINMAFYTISKSYSYPYYTDMPNGDGSWMYTPHNFTEPMYYISYATSTLCSIALWDTAQTDRSAAIDDYLTLVSYGAYDYGYLELTQMCGFGSITDPDYVNSVCSTFIEYLQEQMTLEHSGSTAA